MVDPTKYSLVLALILALHGMGCGKSKASSGQEGTKNSTPGEKRIQAIQVVEAEIEEVVRATGTLAAFDRAVLSVKAPGRLQQIQVDLGSTIKIGDLIAQIEPRDYQLRKEQAAAALMEANALLNEARRNLERIENLNKQGIVPEAELESVQAAFQVAATRVEQKKAELNQAEQMLQDTRIVAPFDGTIEARQASPGEFLNTGTPVVTLVRMDPIRLRLQVAERDAPRIRLGQRVRLLSPADPVIEGLLHRVSPVISPDTRMLVVEADLENREGRLRPGSFVEAELVTHPGRKGLVIPASAVFTFAGLEKVVLVENKTAKEIQIKTGVRRGDLVEVLSGLKAGDLVAAQPAGLKTGQAVVLE